MYISGSDKKLLTWQQVEEAFINCHAIAGDEIETLEDWETYHVPVLGENRVYEEDTAADYGETYSFGKNPIFADPNYYYVGEENGMYYITNKEGDTYLY